MPRMLSLGEGATHLSSADRILVIGCSGVGKSTLAQKIAMRFDLEYLSYDKEVIWLPGWRLRDRAERRNRLAKLIERKRWVLDGNGPSTFDLRVPRADLIIWLHLPRWVALMGVARRVLTHYGTVRPEMAEGCPEQLPDREFLRYIWNFEKHTVPRMMEGIDQYGPNVPMVALRSRKEAAWLLDACGEIQVKNAQ